MEIPVEALKKCISLIFDGKVEDIISILMSLFSNGSFSPNNAVAISASFWQPVIAKKIKSEI